MLTFLAFALLAVAANGQAFVPVFIDNFWSNSLSDWWQVRSGVTSFRHHSACAPDHAALLLVPPFDGSVVRVSFDFVAAGTEGESLP